MFPYLGYPEPSSIGCCKEFNLNSTETNGHNGLSKSVVICLLKGALQLPSSASTATRPIPRPCTAHSGAAWLYCEPLNSAASIAKSFSFPKPLSNSHPSKIQHGPTAHSQVGGAAEQLREQGRRKTWLTGVTAQTLSN